VSQDQSKESRKMALQARSLFFCPPFFCFGETAANPPVWLF
jgi:hypothetical protein